MEDFAKKWAPAIIATLIAVVALIYYVASGRSSLDVNTREMVKKGGVAEVNTGDPKKIQVKCKNGENYEILFTKDQQNYDSLVFNACGPEGTQE